MLDIHTLRKEILPDLNEAKYWHSSIVLNNHVFIFGGLLKLDSFSGTIESLDVITKYAWHMILQGNNIV